MMDGQEYLNQISASNRPVKQSKLREILSSKFFLVGAIGLGALILIMIIGAALGGGGKGGDKNLSTKLMLHLDNTIELIDKYQPSIKSSSLRGSSASLKGILTNTSGKVEEYLTNKYDLKEKDVSKNVEEQATTEKDALNNELFEAKINGLLDRVYARKMTYEISIFMSEEGDVINTTKDDEYKESLWTSYKSLENLYNDFNNFSETNN